ncbi:TPA: hypothetical protein UM684_000714 [Stenotrophomonas maltophilia]|nr:hypothetical protein [Stenotrophomonas maltophilia]HEL3858834.1 hypothetical protein [Stenotrophomonas maltophilia]
MSNDKITAAAREPYDAMGPIDAPNPPAARATLADVKPGGMVRLWVAPWPEIDAILADAYSAGAVGLPFEGIARRHAVRAAVAALSAQPSPGGQGDALRSFACEAVEYFRNRSDVVDGDYGSPSPNEEMKLLSEGEAALAARQPVGWQPMETAPKNGTEILIEVEWRAGIRGKCLVGHYMAGGNCIEDHPPIDAGWYFWNGCMFDRAAKPVRWMHIPPAQAVDLAMPIAMIDRTLGHLSTALDDLDSNPDPRPGAMVTEAMACLRQALTGVPHG